MGAFKKHGASGPSQSYFKSIKASFALIFLLITSCSTNSKKDFEPAKEIHSKEGKVIQITTVGTNSNPAVAIDGLNLLFASKNRSEHKTSQIYEINLNNKKLRRLTHNMSNNVSPEYHPNKDFIIYSSTMDYDIENVDLDKLNAMYGPNNKRQIASMPNHYPNYDIYMSNLGGSDIKRLTFKPQYEGEAQFFSHGKSLIYVRKDKTTHFRELNLKTGRSLKFGAQTNNPRHPAVKNQFYSWVSFENSVHKLHIQSYTKPYQKHFESDDKFNYKNPSFHPYEKKLLVSTTRNAKDYNVHVLDFEKNCFQQITHHTGLDSEPIFSTDGKHIYFTSNRQGRDQIYMVEYKNNLPCVK